jgi:hypothetical protein
MEASDSGAGVDFQHFESRPAPNYIESVRAHVAATGMPETYPGLHPGPIGKDEPFRILHPVSIPRHKRPDGKKAPCPRCHCADKFFEGYLVWFYELGAVAAVGHCCASALQSNEANAEWRQREQLERSIEYLLTFLADVPRHARRARALSAPIAECQRFHDQFRKDGGQYQRALRDATRGGSQLRVSERYFRAFTEGPAGMRTSGSSGDTRDVQYGHLAGQLAVAAKCTLAANLVACTEIFERLDGYGTDDAVLEFVTALSDDEKVAAAVDFAEGIKSLASVEEGLIEFRRFLADANLERITAWGSHLENPTPMRAGLGLHRGGPARLFGIRGLSAKPCSIVVDAALWADFKAAEAA